MVYIRSLTLKHSETIVLALMFHSIDATVIKPMLWQAILKHKASTLKFNSFLQEFTISAMKRLDSSDIEMLAPRQF